MRSSERGSATIQAAVIFPILIAAVLFVFSSYTTTQNAKDVAGQLASEAVASAVDQSDIALGRSAAASQVEFGASRYEGVSCRLSSLSGDLTPGSLVTAKVTCIAEPVVRASSVTKAQVANAEAVAIVDRFRSSSVE